MIEAKNYRDIIGVAGGGQRARPSPPNWNATKDKNVTKKIIVCSVSFRILAHNSTREQQYLTIILIQGARAPSI